MKAMGLQRITLEPKLEALHSTFLERCAAISTAVCKAGSEPVTGQLISYLRLRFLAPLKSPTRSQLMEELPLITTLSVVIDLVAQGWSFCELSPLVVLEFRPASSSDEEKVR